MRAVRCVLEVEAGGWEAGWRSGQTPLMHNRRRRPCAGLDPNCPGSATDAQRLLQAALAPGREALLQRLLPPPAAAQRCPPASRLDMPALATRLTANPALHAVRHASVPALRLLLQAGCPTGAVPAGAGTPPLVAAAARLDMQRCAALLAAGADAREADAHGRSALDVALELLGDQSLIDLAAEETHGAAAASERQQLQLVELLMGAGASCNRWLADHRGTPPPLVHPRVVLALARPPWAWAPQHPAHARWPPAFHAAARTALLALRGRGVRAAGGPAVVLPLEVCHLVLAAAALPLSCWLEPA